MEQEIQDLRVNEKQEEFLGDDIFIHSMKKTVAYKEWQKKYDEEEKKLQNDSVNGKQEGLSGDDIFVRAMKRKVAFDEWQKEYDEKEVNVFSKDEINKLLLIKRITNIREGNPGCTPITITKDYVHYEYRIKEPINYAVIQEVKAELKLTNFQIYNGNKNSYTHVEYFETVEYYIVIRCYDKNYDLMKKSCVIL